MTNVKQKMVDLQDAIFKEKYYVDLYLKVLGKNNMSTASIDQSEFSNKAIIKMTNDFWKALPDDKAIRRPPFFQLCDIAEGS